MKEKFLSEPSILQHLGISKTQFRRNISAGCPSRVKGKGFPLHEVCRWIAARPQKRIDKTLARANALRILDGLKPGVNPLPVATEEGNPVTDTRVIGALGLEAALSRMQKVEEMLHGRLIASIDAGGYDTSPRLKEWQDSLDALRKVESDSLKVMEEKKRLLNVDAVKSWLDKKIETTKAFLLNLPGKVAPGLDGLPWHEIQKRLDLEVRNALAKLSANDLT